MQASQEAKELIKDGLDIIKLDVGEPDFDTPLHIKAAGVEAIHEGSTKYTPSKGTSQVLDAIKQKLLKENQLTYDSSEIMISPGGKHAIYLALLATLDPEDEVIVQTPYWPSYIDMIKLAGGKVKKIHTNLESHYKITPDQLAKAITTRTKMLVLNSPNNPSGVVYSMAELKALAKVLSDHPHVVVLSDEVYDRICFNATCAPSIAQVNKKIRKRCIQIFSLSKTYAMTGWRLGYAAGPANIIQAMARMQSQTVGASSSIAQRAAIDALSKQSLTCIDEMLEKYKSRHDAMFQRISAISEFSALAAEGAFYIFVRAEQAIKKLQLKDDVSLCELLLRKAMVSCVPGSAFGLPMHIRLSFAVRKGRINEAFDRVEQLLASVDDSSATN